METPDDATLLQGAPSGENETCYFCGVLPKYGHMDWCKRTRAPTAQELAAAVVEEYEQSVDEGPSYDLAAMAKAYLKSE